jgi:hypothetical protein
LRYDPLSGENPLDPPSAEVCERARWWLVELGFARGTAGGAAISALARRGYARDMLPVVIAACDSAIQDGTSTEGEWVETGYTDGGIDWSWHQREVMSEVARSLVPIRRDLRMVLELLERIDDLIAAQRDVADL